MTGVAINFGQHEAWPGLSPATPTSRGELRGRPARTPRAAATSRARFWAPLSLTAEQKHSITDPIEMEAAADALPIEQIAKRWIVASDPDQAVEQIKPYVDAGLNHLVFHAPGHDQRRFLDLFARDLAPRLRAL